MKLSRITAYTIRHVYLYKRSLPRLMEVFYWPILDLVVWGFVSLYLSSQKGAMPNFVAFFVGALILWDMLFRSQQGICVSFLEDVWSRNLLNIFVSPLSPAEYITSLMLLSVIKLILTSTVMITLAWVFYSFNIFLLGFALMPFIVNLMIMGWSIGIVTTALILRFGQEAEVLAWGIALLFQPFSAVFYPVSILPAGLQDIALYIPAAHVFEGMRLVISGHGFPMHHMLWAAGLNVVYLSVSLLFFWWNFKAVKKRGLLAKVGE